MCNCCPVDQPDNRMLNLFINYTCVLLNNQIIVHELVQNLTYIIFISYALLLHTPLKTHHTGTFSLV